MKNFMNPIAYYSIVTIGATAFAFAVTVILAFELG